MTEKLYNTIWAYVLTHAEAHSGSENPAVALLDAMLEESIVSEPADTAAVREIYDCIDSALKYGKKQ